MTRRPVRIAFVSSHAGRGGSERYLEFVLDGLGEEWVAGVIALQDGWLVERLRATGRRVEVVPTGARAGLLVGAWRLRRVLRRLGPDVVHANGVKAALVAGLGTTGSRLPVVWVKHDFSWDGWLARLVARRCAAVVGVSDAVVETLGGRGGRVHVVPNAIPVLAPDAAAGRERLRELAGEGEFVVLLGRLHPVKGQLELVEATPRLLTLQPSARVVLVGPEDPAEREYAQAVRGRIRELDLEERVVLAGEQDRVEDLLAASSVVAVPSGPNAPGERGEGFGLVALEAMACGAPVVAYRAGALGDLVGDAGLLLDPGDPGALASALARVLEDAGLRERLAGAGRARAAEFDVSRMLDGLTAVYSPAA